MILKKLNNWFKSLGKTKTVACSLLAVASVACFAAGCKKDPPPPATTYYTVTFNTNGGNTIAPVSLEKGSVIARPANPQLTGSTFVGWYADSNFKTPFYFNSSAKANSDVTLYARWEADTDVAEYTVDFNTGFDGLNVADIETVNRKVFVDQLTLPTYDGYRFEGWAVSMYDDATKLTYMSQDGMTIGEHTTFHAVWTNLSSNALATPTVSVSKTGISWNAIAGVSTYHVTVAGPEGFEPVSTNTGTTTYALDFTTAPIGEYEITVTAVASDSSKNSQPAVRNYVNNMLSRVSFFSVDGTTLSFVGVDNATDYTLAIACGVKTHDHDAVELDGMTYDFANCITAKTGTVEFKVTASAEGYVSAQSRTYTYTKVLDTVSGFSVDETTGVLTWNAVESADKYVVTVDCENHTHNNVVVGATQFDLKTCEATADGINVSVYAVAEGFGNSVPATYKYEKTVLATPGNVTINDKTIAWSAVTGATGYKVKIGNETFDATSNSLELTSDVVELVAANEYVFNVQAVNANGASLWSNDVDARYLAMAASINYSEGYVTWDHVIGATAYNVSVNGGEAVVVSDGKNYAPVTFTQSGENTISVTYTDGTTTSEPVTVKVTAYKVTFNLDGANGTFAEQYKAVGDPVDSFYAGTFAKPGYNFYGWYVGEEDAAGNKKLYEDVYFNETADVTLCAGYTGKVYTLTYNYGEDGSSAVETVEVTYGEHFQLVVPTSFGESAFGGWFTAPEANGIQLTDETGKSVAPWSIAVDEVDGGDAIFAYWNDFVLTFKETKLAGNSELVWAVSKGSRIDKVTEVTIPAVYRNREVKLIEAHGFKGAAKLKTVNIPNTVEQIFTVGALSFDGCTMLEAVNVYEVEDNNVVRYFSIDGVVFDYGRVDEQDGSVELAIFPTKYPTMTYRVPNGITRIPVEAFKNSMLQEIIFSPDLTEIEFEAFSSASELTTVTFEATPAGEEEKPLVIGHRAFYSCAKLEVVNLPKRLAQIGTTKAVIFGSTETSGPEYDNISTSHTNNTVIEDSFYSCSKIREVNVAEGGEYYSSKDGVLYNANKTELLYVPRYFVPTEDSDYGEDTKFTVPSSVSKIATSAFYYASKIKELYIPSTVTEIEEVAFYNAYNIRKITFGGNGFDPVTIGDYAFRNVYYLEELVFETGSQVTEIGKGAFFNNYEMESITIPKTVTYLGDQAFRGWTELRAITFEKPTVAGAELTFGDAVFYGAEKVRELEIPVHAVELGGLFNGLDKLKFLSVAEGNEYYDTYEGILYDIQMTTMLYFPKDIGDGEYTLPTTLTTIGPNVFKNNTKLTTFTIPNTVTTIGDSAFSDSRIRTITFQAGNDDVVLEIGGNAFRYANLVQELVLPSRAVKIGAYAFANMDSLNKLTLAANLEAISTYAIYQNPNLTNIVVPDKVKKIDFRAITNNNALKTITFGANSQLEEIGPYGLYGNAGLETLAFPASLKSIGYYALAAGTSSSARGSLREVTFAANSKLETIGDRAFYYTRIESITIPKSVTEIQSYAFGYTYDLVEVIFEKGGTQPLTIGAVSEYKTSSSETKTIAYGYTFYYSGIQRIEFPARLTEIGRYAFYRCYDLEDATLEEGVESNLFQIGEYAFYDCQSLKGFTFPKSMTNLGAVRTSQTGSTLYTQVHPRPAIGRYAFYKCYTMQYAEFEQGGTREMSIADGAFYDCWELTEVNLPSRLVSYEVVDPKTSDVVATYKPLGEILSSGGAPIIFGNCHKLTDINIITNDGVPYIPENEYFSVDGVIYSQSKEELIRAPIGKTSYEVPNTVRLVDDYAFARCVALETLTFEAGNDDLPLIIGEEAFRQCTSLKEIALAKRVSVIEASAFYYCTNLEKVDLSTKLTTFDATVFEGCTKLTQMNTPTDCERYVAVDGVVYNAGADRNTLYFYPASKADKVFTVPASVKTIYRYAFYNNSYLEEVILPDGLQAIGEYAFYNVSSLKAVNIKKNVTNIGDYAFYNCASLELLTFEEGGTSPLVIGNEEYVNKTDYVKVGSSWTLFQYGYVFAYCPLITNVTLPERTKVIADNTFAYCLGLRTVNVPANVEKLGNAAFLNCERLTSVDFATEKVTALPYKIFMNCYSLESFDIPASITAFSTDSHTSYKQSLAFAFCTSLESVTFAEDCAIETLPRSVFAGCSALTTIDIPASVVEIASGASSSTQYGVFYGCTSLEEVNFAEEAAIESIGGAAFYNCYALKAIEIPETVTWLGTYAFAYCKSLESVVIPEDCDVNDSYALFYNCESLADVTLPGSMYMLPGSFFQGCKNITELDMSQFEEVYEYGLQGTGITEVTVYADVYYEYAAFYGMRELTKVEIEDGFDGFIDEMFSECDKLEEIVIPDSVTNLSYYLFSGCDSLSSVTLPNNEDLTSLGSGTFAYCTNLKTITIPESVTALEDELFCGSGLTTINIPMAVEGIYWYAFQNCMDLETVNIPASAPMDTIYDSAFYDCKALKNITLPNALTTIENLAFYGCESLESINIPAMCTNIGVQAFFGCTALEEYVVDPSNIVYAGDSVEEDVVWNATKTEIIKVLPQKTGSFTIPENVTVRNGAFANSGLTEVVLPSTMTTIPEYAFIDSAIETIVIPSTVTTIGQYAFANSKLKSVEIPASVTTINKNAFYQCYDLATVTFEAGSDLLELKDYAFAYCTSLESITIPYRVRTVSTAYAVPAYCFKGCTNLEEVTFEETPATGGVEGVLNFGNQAFMWCKSIKRLDFPAALATNSTSATSYMAFNTNTFYGCEELETVTFNPVEGTIISFGSGSFACCTKLKNIELPETTAYLAPAAFMYTAIESVTIPARVERLSYGTAYLYNEATGQSTSLGSNMGAQFYGCTSLKTVVFEATDTILEKSMFEGCTALTSITFNTDKLVQFKDRVFAGCTALTSISIPTTITTFGADVFADWTSAQTIYTNKTESQINAWSYNWNKGCAATVVYL